MSNPFCLNAAAGPFLFSADQSCRREYTGSLPARKYALASCFIALKSHPAAAKSADTRRGGIVGLLAGRSSAHATAATSPQVATKYFKVRACIVISPFGYRHTAGGHWIDRVSQKNLGAPVRCRENSPPA